MVCILEVWVRILLCLSTSQLKHATKLSAEAYGFFRYRNDTGSLQALARKLLHLLFM